MLLVLMDIHGEYLTLPIESNGLVWDVYVIANQKVKDKGEQTPQMFSGLLRSKQVWQ